MRILRLEVNTGNMEEQLAFYRDSLEVQVDKIEDGSFEVVLGYSVLKFIQDEEATPYHIAIHIPDNEEEKALEWLKSRVSVLKNEGNEIIDFSGWNAKSLYFYDKNKNVMEFIARKDLNPSAAIEFSGHSLHGIAEVGLATHNIEEKYNFLNKHCGLEVYDGSFQEFCAIGGDRGLLITIDKNVKKWFPTGDRAFASEFRMSFSHGDERHDITYIKDRLVSSR